PRNPLLDPDGGARATADASAPSATSRFRQPATDSGSVTTAGVPREATRRRAACAALLRWRRPLPQGERPGRERLLHGSYHRVDQLAGEEVPAHRGPPRQLQTLIRHQTAVDQLHQSLEPDGQKLGWH